MPLALLRTRYRGRATHFFLLSSLWSDITIPLRPQTPASWVSWPRSGSGLERNTLPAPLRFRECRLPPPRHLFWLVPSVRLPKKYRRPPGIASPKMLFFWSALRFDQSKKTASSVPLGLRPLRIFFWSSLWSDQSKKNVRVPPPCSPRHGFVMSASFRSRHQIPTLPNATS